MRRTKNSFGWRLYGSSCNPEHCFDCPENWLVTNNETVNIRNTGTRWNRPEYDGTGRNMLGHAGTQKHQNIGTPEQAWTPRSIQIITIILVIIILILLIIIITIIITIIIIIIININKIAAYDVGEHLLFMSFINPTGFFDNLRPRVSIRSGTVSAFFNQFDAVSYWLTQKASISHESFESRWLVDAVE